ncbi:benzoate/H(+) symporter BenE family transporter [Metabacillus fastidiosus]|uniref:Benzoate/H(+) symporter BenE family transporter n=1 Tax=Metabacillus fastidiosus TaxID=1458 RepID=A0ABU6P4N4_9BACI|nr:benzoate/H(+) symporter BenE family transporter [Metabacillus fastidiosus]MED4404038.1 benzoate/H(+) symporter BenE family transporter [Metabacillus fastidiosus]
MNSFPGIRRDRPSLKDLNHKNISAGIVAGIFIITGPTALILEASVNGNFSIAQTVLWIFAVYVFGGLFGIILPLYSRIPIVGGHTLTGVAFLATVTSQFTFHELIGAYIISGLLMLFIGSLGLFSKLIKLVPKEIISAMLAGMITKYMVNFIVSISHMLIVGLVSLITFFIFSRWRVKIPPVIAAIIIGFIVLILFYPLNSSEWTSGMMMPKIQLPDFNLVSFLSVSIPLALLILSNDAAVGVGALEQNNYRTPIKKIITLSGLFSIITSFFGGQSANIAGMATVICSDEEAGPKEKRYMGAVVAGFLLLAFGLFSWKLVPLIQALPKEFISIIVGFSLLTVFGNSVQQAFSNHSMKISTVFAFIIALSNITILSISAPVWSLLAGSLIARYIENDSIRKLEKKKAT